MTCLSQSKSCFQNNWNMIAITIVVFVVVINLSVSYTLAIPYDVIVEKVDHNIQVKRDNMVIYDGANATHGIQVGINNLKPGQHMYVYNGTYAITRPLRLGNHSYMEGQGINTVFDFSKIGNQHAAILNESSHLSNIKFLGSIDPLPNDFTQGILVNDNVIIKNILISHMGYGISVNNSNNVTLSGIRCEFIQSKNDWAACIHGGERRTSNLYVDSFRVTDSNRAVEFDASARNVTVQNGYLLRIKNFNNTGHEAFTLDVHDHIGSGRSTNITYRNVYMKDSYAPSTKESALMANEHSGDYKPNLPKDIAYENITVVNPSSPWQVGGIGITIKDSRIMNSTKSIFVLYKNSRNIEIINTSAFVGRNSSFIRLNDTLLDTGIQNVSIVHNKVTTYPNRTSPTMSLQSINGLFLENNTITNAPTLVPTIDVKYTRNFASCNNLILYVNGTNKIWPAVKCK